MIFSEIELNEYTVTVTFTATLCLHVNHLEELIAP